MNTTATHRVVYGWSAYSDFDNLADALEFMADLLRLPALEESLAMVRLLDLTTGRVHLPTLVTGYRPVAVTR